MPRREIEGDWILGWPDRRRPRSEFYKDAEGRVVFSRSPFLDLEGLLTPTENHFIVAQVQMPEPVHPEDYRLSISGEVERPVEYTLDELRKLRGRTVRAVIECAGNDADFFNYLQQTHVATRVEIFEYVFARHAADLGSILDVLRDFLSYPTGESCSTA